MRERLNQTVGRIGVAGIAAASVAFLAIVNLRASIPLEFHAVAPMSTPRVLATATRLQDGRVLVLGGLPGPKASAEIFNPVTSAWSPAKPMSVGRSGHAATLLTDGRVFVAGGQGSAGNSAEIYNPNTDAWIAVPPMTASRYGASAVTLVDGRVLVAGGDESVEIYDPDANQWSRAPGLGRNASFMTLVDLGGIVLAAGGFVAGIGVTDASFHFLGDNVWFSAGAMNRGRGAAAFSVLPDGRVLVVGGVGRSGPLGPAANNEWTDGEVYDWSLRRWTLTPPTGNVGGSFPAAALRKDGLVLAVGGQIGDTASNGAALYDLATDTWSPAAPMITGRYQGVAVTIPGGRTLVAGGTTAVLTFNPTDLAEVYGFESLPFANAGADQTIDGCATCLGVATLDASGTIDGDGDTLTYTWKEGPNTLAVTTDPVKITTVALGLGTHTITLMVTDGAGAFSFDTVVVVVRDVTDGVTDQLAQCRAERGALESQINSNLAVIEADLRREFGDAQFSIPGGTPAARLQNLTNAIVAMSRGQKRAVYRALGGL